MKAVDWPTDRQAGQKKMIMCYLSGENTKHLIISDSNILGFAAFAFFIIVNQMHLGFGLFVAQNSPFDASPRALVMRLNESINQKKKKRSIIKK